MQTGKEIKKLRKQLKLTQPVFVDRVGPSLSQSLLSLVENGKAELPLSTICRIAEEFGNDALALLVAQCAHCCIHSTTRTILNLSSVDTQQHTVHVLQSDAAKLLQQLKTLTSYPHSADPAAKAENMINIHEVTNKLIQDVQTIAVLYQPPAK